MSSPCLTRSGQHLHGVCHIPVADEEMIRSVSCRNHPWRLPPEFHLQLYQESDDRLPFLDADGSLKVGVYRKQTHADRYLPYESHHPIHVKRGVVRSLVRRAEEISSDDQLLKKEMRHLKTMFPVNG